MTDPKPASLRLYDAVLSAALNQAVVWGWLEVNPAKRTSIPKQTRSSLEIPTREEIQLLVDTMPTAVSKMAVDLAARTGAHRGELCALQWSDIRRRCDQTAKVCPSGQGRDSHQGHEIRGRAIASDDPGS